MSDQLATFVVDGSLYGVDVTRVQEALRHQPLTPVPHASAASAGLVNLRGQVVLTVDLRPRLGLPPVGEDAQQMMVVVQVGGETVSLLVDEIGDVVDVEPDRVEAPPDTLDPAIRPLIRAACTLDERLLLVLDVDEAAAA